MFWYSLVLPFLLTWGSVTVILLLLTATDTADPERMFSRREK